ncbi:MAG: 50S ribosomal protein L17 [Peptostreptococcaceae bacterium]|nr:50S ribosomal protein L17 [Peptostreptococcaceae bacterium]
MAIYRKLGMVSAHRKAMLRNMTTDILRHGKVTTTETRAKEARRMVEKMITLGKRGDLHARRQALSYVMDKAVVKTLFDEIAPKYSERNGGYTRIMKLGPRKGDGAPMAIIELV